MAKQKSFNLWEILVIVVFVSVMYIAGMYIWGLTK